MTADDEGTTDGDVIEGLSERVAALVADWDGVMQVEMFGCPSFTVRQELFCVVSEQGVSLTKLPDEGRAMLAEHATVAPFDADGRTVEGWATVALEGLPEDETLEPFLRASYQAAIEEADH